MKRLYRVMVQDPNGTWRAVRHYQSRAAAQHRVCEMSTRERMTETLFRIESSAPVEFVFIEREYRNGVAL